MTPAVDVVIATYRPGGAVIPLRGLAEQTFRDFSIIVVSECGRDAVRIAGDSCAWTRGALVAAEPIPYHSPPHVLNAGLAASRADIVVFLADFAYPEPQWLETLVETLSGSKASPSAVAGAKCSHGEGNPWTCRGAGCGDRAVLPGGLTEPVSVIYPFQHAFTLGNLAFWRGDAALIGGVDERFSGGHGYEDENFVARLIASSGQQAVVAKAARVHHYWPYSSGYKPLLKPEFRTWAMGLPNETLHRLLMEGETLVGKRDAQRVQPLYGATPEMLDARTPAAPPKEE